MVHTDDWWVVASKVREVRRAGRRVLRFAGRWRAYRPLEVDAEGDSERQKRGLPIYALFANLTADQIVDFAASYGPLGLTGAVRKAGRGTAMGGREVAVEGVRGRLLLSGPVEETVEDWMRQVEELRCALLALAGHAEPNREAAARMAQAVRIVMASENGGLRLRWAVDSLLQSMWLHAAVDASAGRPVRLCARDGCGRLFVARHPRTFYCSRYCQVAEHNRTAYLRRRQRERENEGPLVDQRARA